MSSESFSLSTVFFVQTTTVVFQIHFFKSQRKIKTAAPLQSDRGPVGCDASISTKALEEGFLESFFSVSPISPQGFPWTPNPTSSLLLTSGSPNTSKPNNLYSPTNLLTPRHELNPIPSLHSPHPTSEQSKNPVLAKIEIPFGSRFCSSTCGQLPGVS